VNPVKKSLLVIIVIALAAGAGVYTIYTRVHTAFQSFTGSEQFVDIPAGASTRTIGSLLVSSGVVRDTITFRAALWLNGGAKHLKAGEYRFDHAMTPLAVIDKIARGDVYVIVLTFPEGLTIAEMAKVFEAHGLGDASAFVAASADPLLITGVDPAAHDLEGYLFPDTYRVSRHTTASQLVHLMIDRFNKALTPELTDAARVHGWSVRQLVTLASIVEKETGQPDERPLVSAVYVNRLRIGMALQCDPTVIYALAGAGRYTGNLRRDDLNFDSPYNTYRYPGLPPGPIASPGKQSLEAAAHPADSDFLYFVSRNDGSHEFAHSLEEHNRNVQKFQVQYFRRRPT
jgi:UPF0755 protein